jgi:two-component system response regulator BaeR
MVGVVGSSPIAPTTFGRNIRGLVATPGMPTARVKAVLRPSRATQRTPTALAPLQVEEPGWRASWQGRALDLTPNEFRPLRVLASQPGRVYARAQLLDLLGNGEDRRAATERTVDSHVKNLRRKPEQAGAGSERIRSVYGIGYRYDD